MLLRYDEANSRKAVCCDLVYAAIRTTQSETLKQKPFEKCNVIFVMPLGPRNSESAIVNSSAATTERPHWNNVSAKCPQFVLRLLSAKPELCALSRACI